MFLFWFPSNNDRSTVPNTSLPKSFTIKESGILIFCAVPWSFRSPSDPVNWEVRWPSSTVTTRPSWFSRPSITSWSPIWRPLLKDSWTLVSWEASRLERSSCNVIELDKSSPIFFFFSCFFSSQFRRPARKSNLFWQSDRPLMRLFRLGERH